MIIGCGKSKVDHPAPAGDLYTGSYVRNCVAWARSVTDEAHVLILSAKYGLVPITRVIAPYTASFAVGRGFAKSDRHLWEEPCPPSAIRRQIAALGIPAGRVILLAGKDYARVLTEASRGTLVPYNPFKGIAPDDRIGYQMHLMKDHHGRMPA